jgi:hypothetical protein
MGSCCCPGSCSCACNEVFKEPVQCLHLWSPVQAEAAWSHPAAAPIATSTGINGAPASDALTYAGAAMVWGLAESAAGRADAIAWAAGTTDWAPSFQVGIAAGA